MSDLILEVEGLSKRYGKRMAVDDLSFGARRGAIHGFLGRNGAGKSTTIRMILGLIRPTSGVARIAGHRVRAGSGRGNATVGAIVESPAFYDYLSARKNLELLASLSGGASRARIDAVVELVGLTERQHEKVSVFSHGMRQRLGLAQALLPSPELIILDEPLDGLDPNGIRHLRDVMLNVVAEEGVTIFLSSHILSEVELTCDNVVVIHEGRKVYDGPTADLIGDHDTVRLRVCEDEGEGSSNTGALLSRLEFIEAAFRVRGEGGAWRLTMDAARAPELNRALVEAGLDVLELTPMKQSLEDVFIQLTSNPPPGDAS